MKNTVLPATLLLATSAFAVAAPHAEIRHLTTQPIHWTASGQTRKAVDLSYLSAPDEQYGYGVRFAARAAGQSIRAFDFSMEAIGLTNRDGNSRGGILGLETGPAFVLGESRNTVISTALTTTLRSSKTDITGGESRYTSFAYGVAGGLEHHFALGSMHLSPYAQWAWLRVRQYTENTTRIGSYSYTAVKDIQISDTAYAYGLMLRGARWLLGVEGQTQHSYQLRLGLNF